MARGDLLADGPQRQVHAGHQHHRLEAGEHVARACWRAPWSCEPSWPVFMAWSMSSASPPRHSPTMMRSGRMRRALRTRSRIVIVALALDVGRARLQRHDVRLLQLQLGGVLDGDDALVVRDERRQDVQQRRLARAGAAGDDDVQACLARRRCRKSTISGVAVPKRIRSSTVNGVAANLRMVRRRAVQRRRRDDGVDARAVRQPGVHHRADDSSMRRPSGATMRSMMRITCSSSWNVTSVSSSLPFALDVDLRAAR